MGKSNTLRSNLYKNIGKLMYALARIDGSIHTNEVDHLRSYVRSYWLHIDDIEDDHGLNAAFKIEATFDGLLENRTEPEICFQEFSKFYKENSEAFSPEIKRLILDTANAMAKSYAKKNKAELILLSKIEILFLDI
ncbi:MAG: hypothetical protein WBB24_10745 [Maribacter sp.]